MLACALLLPGLNPDAALGGVRRAPSLPQCSRSALVPQQQLRAATILMAAEDEQQQQQQQQQPRRRRWRKRAKSAGATLAAAALLAMPRGPASAAQDQPPTPPTVSRDVGHGRSTQPPLAFLGSSRQSKVTPPFEAGEMGARPDQIDMDALLSKKAASKYTDRDFLFSEQLNARSALEDELEQLDSARAERSGSRTVGKLLTYGGALGGVYLTVTGLSNVERWMKQQELRDIEEEREITGQYISVDAGDVETAIDPLTGKNLTIVGNKKKDNSTSTAAPAEPKEEAKVPWLLRVLGLGGLPDSDADDFWAPPAPTVRKEDKGAKAAEGGAATGEGGAEGGGDPAAGGDGAPVDDDDDDDDEDSSGVDALGDLLG